MSRVVAFLRAINVGGRTVRMDALKALFERMGFADVETFIASGNVVFRTGSKSLASAERRIERHLQDALGYRVDAFLRTDAEVAAAAQPPFTSAVSAAAVAINVGFVRDPLDAAAEKTVRGFETGIDRFRVRGREVYWLCRKKQSESTFSGARFERALGVQVTFRGLSTIERLTAKYQPGRPV